MSELLSYKWRLYRESQVQMGDWCCTSLDDLGWLSVNVPPKLRLAAVGV